METAVLEHMGGFQPQTHTHLQICITDVVQNKEQTHPMHTV